MKTVSHQPLIFKLLFKLLFRGSTALFICLSSCTQPPQAQAPLTLVVISASQDGSFLLSGTAAFPDGTKLGVQGIRYLQPDPDLTPNLTNQTPLYTVLDRHRTTVQGGRWQAKLNLRQLDHQRASQEVWQQTFPIVGLRLQPNSHVIFTVNFDPVEQTPDFWVKLRRQQGNLAVPATQVSEIWTLLPPAEHPGPSPIPSAQVFIDGWKHAEIRASKKSETSLPTVPPNGPPSPPPDFAQSNAPLTSREQLR